MKTIFKIIIIIFSITSISFAFVSEDDETSFVSDLATVLAGENNCGIVFNQDIVIKYIQENIRPESTVIMQDLGSYISYEISQYEESSEIVKKANCMQINRVANSLGFLTKMTNEEQTALEEAKKSIEYLMSEEYEPVLIINLIHAFTAEELCNITFTRDFYREWDMIKSLKSGTNFMIKFDEQFVKYKKLMSIDATFCPYKIKSYTKDGIIESIN